MNEAETRAEHIDPALAAAGWGVVEGSRVRREVITLGRIQGGGKRGKQDIADYVLEYRNRKLAVIEAKKWDAPYTEGVAQAKNYCGKLTARFGYSTNGQKIYAMDMQSGWEGDVAAFPTPDELWDMVFAEANEWRDKFASIPFEDKGGLFSARYYQENAVNRVLDAVAEDKDRILLTLATGTGKTAIAFQVAWKLFHSRWSLQKDGKRRPRILFLADRNILADQAFNAFSAFEDGVCVRIDPSEISKKGYVPTNGSIFFTIFQTFMSEGSGQPNYGSYPSDFFDFIIIDECHRGGANDEGNWRGILEYFSPAVQLGLTATPKRKNNADTYRYFGDPVYVYSLKEGINDGFLTPFRVVQIATTMDDYTYIPDDVVIEGEVEEGKRYEEKDFNRTIIIPERERKRVKVFMDAISPNEKTIVFCATQDHALMIRDMINQVKKVPDANYCHRVTANDGALGEMHLRNFQDNDRTIPTILTTSQKLSTGVDARNVRNIVLMRPVNSMIEFKQIIGRGTRLYDGKDYFTIYDFVKAHHLFNDPEWDGDPIEPTGGPSGGGGGEGGDDTGGGDGGDTGGGEEKPNKIVIKLADGKERLIQHMTATNFVGPDGKLLSASQFIQLLYDTLSLPEYLKDEDQLREIWSDPATRKHLLGRLEDAGFGRDNLAAIQSMIDAQNSDLFDVLQFVAYNKPTVPRVERVKASIDAIHGELDPKQQEFVDFVLAQYVALGVDELDRDKLPQLITVKYGNLNDGLAQIGGIDQAMNAFLGSQRQLYQRTVRDER
ncbi:restriction endonuclease subunit R [Erythrobacter sp. JL475]|nr:restriction endonuclease subunit R [Erythrobacter sp. JL475]